ncbi:K(+)-transporting ATPase subunit F [Streptomyces sp. WMMC500]|nr:K(+)-transporting ATPase subunit F [Streptomyces sp. WMMC500]WBB64338.1 K(+)-transporting ATPase subunit F [Streptomyces sp. WMMC500]
MNAENTVGLIASAGLLLYLVLALLFPDRF